MNNFRKINKGQQLSNTYTFEEVQMFLLVLADRVYQIIQEEEFDEISSCFNQTLKELKESKRTEE